MKKLSDMLRVPFMYDAVAVSEETGLYCPEPTLTTQADKDDADINVIVKRFGLTGELPTNVRIPLQTDFVATTSFHEAMNTLRLAEEAFMEMPANVRERFNHDPGRLVEFVSVPENREEAIKLGLVVPAVELKEEPLLVRMDPVPPPKEGK